MNIRPRSSVMALGLAPVVIALQLIVIELCKYLQVIWLIFVTVVFTVLVEVGCATLLA